MSEKENENGGGETDPPRPTNDQITESVFGALSGDENLSDDDRRAIVTGLSEKAGVKPPVAPKSEHWSDKKLW